MKNRRKHIRVTIIKLVVIALAVVLNPFQPQSNASIKDLVASNLSYNSAEKAHAISYPGASGGTVAVTGLIDPTLSFVLDSADMYFGSLSTSATKYATKPSTGGSLSVPTGTNTTNFQTSTNSAHGITININDAYNGLRATTGAGSGVTVIAAASAASAPAESFFTYGIVDAAGGGLAMNANFSGTTGSAAIATTIKTFAASTVPLNAASARVIFAAKATTLTKSADYTDTATITCTANY